MKNSIKYIFLFFVLVNTAIASENAPIPDLSNDISLHGDIKVKWNSSWGGEDKEVHAFNTEATLGCDYDVAPTWISVKMKAASVNGKSSIISLTRAIIGYQLYDTKKYSIGIEIGRNKMDTMFDSKMQFNSYFNGIHVVYNLKEPNLFDFTLHGGPHLIDAEYRHYGWVGEAIWKNIGTSPITLKYSFTDWNPPHEDDRYDVFYDYALSQITACYEIADTVLYGAYLFNHKEDKYNDGFYLGFTAGQIRKARDFLFDVNFQSMKNRLISPLDLKGLKRGVQVKVMYALADSLCLEGKFSLHDSHHNKKLEMQAVYSW